MNTKYLYVAATLLVLSGCAQQPAATNTSKTTTPATSNTSVENSTASINVKSVVTPATAPADDTMPPTSKVTPATDPTLPADTSTTPTTPAKTPVAPVNKVKPAAEKVTISNFSFGPASLTVKPGTTITWTNQDSAPHNITLDQPSSGASALGSGTLAQGSSYSYTFDTVGTYNYHCSIHPMMKASVTVAE